MARADPQSAADTGRPFHGRRGGARRRAAARHARHRRGSRRSAALGRAAGARRARARQAPRTVQRRLHRQHAQARHHLAIPQRCRSDAGAEGGLRHVARAAGHRGRQHALAAGAGSRRAAARRPRAGLRDQFRSVPYRCRTHPQGTAGLQPRRARPQRALPHDGGSGALQPPAAARTWRRSPRAPLTERARPNPGRSNHSAPRASRSRARSAARRAVPTRWRAAARRPAPAATAAARRARARTASRVRAV